MLNSPNRAENLNRATLKVKKVTDNTCKVPDKSELMIAIVEVAARIVAVLAVVVEPWTWTWVPAMSDPGQGRSVPEQGKSGNQKGRGLATHGQRARGRDSTGPSTSGHDNGIAAQDY